jgi:hypothetical protein
VAIIDAVSAIPWMAKELASIITEEDSELRGPESVATVFAAINMAAVAETVVALAWCL